MPHIRIHSVSTASPNLAAAKEKDARLAKLAELTKELRKREPGREPAELERRLRDVEVASNAARN